MLVVVPLLRRQALLLLAAGLVVADAVWLGAGLTHEWSHALLGWLPLPVTTLLAGHACWQVNRHLELDAETRRFWRHLTAACLLFTGGVIANTIDALGHGTPSQRVGPASLAFYLSVLGVVLWALLRLPSWQRTRSDWIRFGLDLCMVVITIAVLVWHLSLRNHHEWTMQTGSGGAVLAITVVGFLSMATFVKVAFAGAGRLDRRAVYTLATGSAISASLGSLSPFLISRPYLSTSLIAVPVAALSIHVAAVIQQHAGSRTPPPRRSSRRVSITPYLAVAVTDALLLANTRSDMTETAIMQIAAVTLTGVVVIRQIIALRDNKRLLSTVDAQLSDLRRYQNRLEHQATHDKLTGTGNRALLERHVDELLTAGQPFHLVLLDIDDFKAVNDRLGHHVGDSLLTVISHRLTTVVGGRGVVARLGGDEFAVVVPAPADHVEAVLERILATVRQPAELGEHTTVAAISIGVTASRTGDNPSELLRRADVAMYAAKTAGGHRWHWFDQAMDESADAAARLSADLRQALSRGQIFALYQPIIDLTTGLCAGGEVLMRWQHPDRGLISPDLFIPLAECSGCIVDLGYWILEHACRQTATWQRRYGDHAPAKISINVSARQLSEPDFVDRVQEILERTGVDTGRLVLEVTETAVFATTVAVQQLERLKTLGIRIALDDFGTGHSSLSLLLDCPVDLLKVDKSFVSGAAADQAGALIVKNLIGFTSDFAIEAVAEGVETPEQAALLRRLGYQYAQGYLYARPMPAADFEQHFTTATVMTPTG
ncbi:bifunctional diguanylate cyclase/phosphodiesterase [Actinoplanes sp. TRM 88003]|uniref:Bifunctional diguanylate cyclase/phosphodiesterase n=1 Tax=Paractinoplanes aksuensis TaxID=2939490 RepID=A0ABT1E4J0_9ACTN|nr:EAL domain-containing protein [Actinoplanes aksuensis]MCO8278033.1 bifunctional diguanylate cyclase/phosphodiesterase [Actinoplanes aksuensis]